MSGIVGGLFGKASQNTQDQQSTSGYGALPQFAQNAFQTGVNGLSDIATTNPTAFAPAGFNATQQQGFNLANQGFTPTNADTFGQNLNMFMNPYTNDVINGTNNQILLANQGLLSQLGGDASQAGAFGGTRQGVAQAQQNKDSLTTIANTDAALNQTGYNNAANMAVSNINQGNTNLQQQINNLLGIGNQQQAQATAVQQAPITALQSLIAAAQGLPASSNSSENSIGTGASGGILGTGSSPTNGGSGLLGLSGSLGNFAKLLGAS